MSSSTNPLIGVYRLCGSLGNVGRPGAPVAYFTLLINPSRSTANGIVHIKQAIEGPNSDPVVDNAKGRFGTLVSNGETFSIIQLTGTYVEQGPPLQPIEFTRKFTAYILLAKDGKGQGSFTYGGNTVNNVPAEKEDC